MFAEGDKTRTWSEDKMLDTKLIVVDGLPGSGKSTTVQWLTERLQRNGIKTRWLQESELSHPLWWYDYWDGTNYLPPDFDNIPMGAFIETSLKRWEDFVASVRVSGELYVVESVFFQNAVAMFLMGDAKPTLLVDYAHKVQRITRDLNPVLIYFYQTNVAAALRKICDLRGQDFEDELLKNMESFPYLRRRGLTGLAGVTILWQEIRRLTDVLFDRYTISKLALENSEDNWPYYRQQILDFLGVPF